jgi:hypothetical protein
MASATGATGASTRRAAMAAEPAAGKGEDPGKGGRPTMIPPHRLSSGGIPYVELDDPRFVEMQKMQWSRN